MKNEYSSVLLTQEVLAMLRDESLTETQRFQILMGAIDGRKCSGLIASFAKSLKTGMETVNSKRLESEQRRREQNRLAQQKHRNEVSISQHKSALLSIGKQVSAAEKPVSVLYYTRLYNNIPPKSPLRGEGSEDLISKAKETLELVMEALAGSGLPGMDNETNGKRVAKAVWEVLASGVESGRFLSQMADWIKKWQAESFDYAPAARNLPRWIRTGGWEAEAKNKKSSAAESTASVECGVMMA